MRTTVNIADHLLVQAKKLAASRRIPLARLVEDSLRKYLAEYRSEARSDRRPYDIPLMDAGKVVAGVDLDDTSELMEL